MDKVLAAFYGLGMLLGTWGMAVSGFGYWALSSSSMGEVALSSFQLAELDEWDYSISYSYQVNEFEHNRTVEIAKEAFHNSDLDTDSIKVVFNLRFPSYADIKGLDVEKRKEAVGCALSILFVAFLSSLYWP